MRETLPLVARQDRLEHVVPAVSAVHVAGTQSTAFEVAKLVEHEQGMIAGAGIMAVPDAHLLLAVGRAHARIHVEHDATGWPSAVHKIDPLARQVGKSSEVLGRCEPLRLEASHLTRRSCAPLRRFATDNPAHGRIVAQALGVVHILVSGKATKYRLPEQPGQCVPTILATACVGQNITRHHSQADCVVEFAIGENPASEVTREPRNWSIKRRSKSSRTAFDPDSPLGCAMAASLDPGQDADRYI